MSLKVLCINEARPVTGKRVAVAVRFHHPENTVSDIIVEADDVDAVREALKGTAFEVGKSDGPSFIPPTEIRQVGAVTLDEFREQMAKERDAQERVNAAIGSWVPKTAT